MTSLLASGRTHLAIPGPSIMPDRVLRAMHRAAPNIYEGELEALTESVYADLNAIARNDGHALIFIGNGHAAWEASLVNTLSRGDEILALVTGRFGQGWVQMAEGLGIKVHTLDFGSESSVDPARVQEVLGADTDHRIRSVITVQTDTATSVSNDIPAIRAAMDAAEHPALLMVDCIASFACEAFDVASWGVDVMLTASQKGLMTPPGLAIIFFRETAWPAYRRADLKTPYWDWESRTKPAYLAARFCGTPPTHHLYGLREALDMLLEESMENVWRRHEVQARAVWAAVESWGIQGAMTLNVPDINDRSRAVTCIRTQEGLGLRLREWCEREAGVTLGIGLSLNSTGRPNDNVFRIGHMGHLNPHALLGTLACIQTGLQALKVGGTGDGVGAASAIISEAVLAGVKNPDQT